jgi:hypothetical protein
MYLLFDCFLDIFVSSVFMFFFFFDLMVHMILRYSVSLLSSPRTDAGRLFNHFQIFISHNVPAVYDVFASPIKETVGFQGLQKCGLS